MTKLTPNSVASALHHEVSTRNNAMRIRIRKLLELFGYDKRRESNIFKITEVLAEKNVLISPPLVKIGDKWELNTDNYVTLIIREGIKKEAEQTAIKIKTPEDAWFEKIKSQEFRSEREVETKFIIPLLTRLGFTEEDRYDGMTFDAFHGSRKTCIEADFALFDASNEKLRNQVLLVAEAKREKRLIKPQELINAQRQVKSYAIWLSCHYGLVTDGNTVQVLDLFPSLNGINVLFECKREELSQKFSVLKNYIGKEALVKHYEAQINSINY